MEVINTSISGLYELIPSIYEDNRGFFFESFNIDKFKSLGLPSNFVQDNQSFSHKGVLRGLHFQLNPSSQGKLVRVITGKVLDIAVDLRIESATFGKHEKFILDSSQNNLVYIPEGFAHGFLALEDSIFSYKCTQYYDKTLESGIIWNDPDLNIDWGIRNPIVSFKDQQLDSFSKLFSHNFKTENI